MKSRVVRAWIEHEKRCEKSCILTYEIAEEIRGHMAEGMDIEDATRMVFDAHIERRVQE